MAVLPQTATISTLSGQKFLPQNITTKNVTALDIASSLAKICRYNGQLSDYYSVAQHSCLMYDYALEFGCEDIAPQTLMHDSTEAYLGDLITPLKRMKEFDFYEELETRVWEVIARKFKIPVEHDPRVKDLDLWIRVAETRDLRPNAKPYKLEATNRFLKEHQDPIVSWSPKKSKTEMMKRMKRIGIKVE